MGSGIFLSRRTALAAALAALAGREACAATFAELAARAEQGDLVWYESNRRDQLDRIGAAFTRSYSRIRSRPESIAGGVGIVGRVQQEYQANMRNVDLVTLGGGKGGAPFFGRGRGTGGARKLRLHRSILRDPKPHEDFRQPNAGVLRVLRSAPRSD
jgi:hypothetical protein